MALLLALLASASALRLGTAAAGGGRCAAPRAQATEDPPVQTAVDEAGAAPARVPKGRFLAWVQSEKELEEWKKANPVDPVETLKGPLTSVAILTAGFYTIVRRACTTQASEV